MYLYRIGISGKMDDQEVQRGHFVLTLFSHNISEAVRILCTVAGWVMYPVSDATIYEEYPGENKPCLQIWGCTFCGDLRSHMDVTATDIVLQGDFGKYCGVPA